jgi:hypothetical protein
LAVQLLLELLAHPQPDEPVPVFFSLVGWSPQEQPRLQDWLMSRLERDYPALRGFGGDTARALVERGKILPILDGLDEVPAELRPGIITGLNRAAFPAPSGLILTSRRAEYAAAVTDAKDVLTAAAVIAPLALTRLDVVSYLRKLLFPDPGAAWSAVLGELETGTAADLAAVTASPLGLWLVRTVYLDGHRDPTPLVEETHPDRYAHPTLQAHLLAQLLAFYDYPAEHWIHLRTTNPIESTFATVRHRTKITRGPGSRAAGLAMAFKLIEAAQNRWRAVNAPHLVALVRAGATFESGQLVERPDEHPQPAAA